MRAGRLRHAITVEKPATTRAQYGEQQKTWEKYVGRRADVKSLQGKEFFDAQQSNVEVSHEILLRYDSKTSAITADMRVNFKNRILEITSPPKNVGERNRWIKLMCVER